MKKTMMIQGASALLGSLLLGHTVHKIGQLGDELTSTKAKQDVLVTQQSKAQTQVAKTEVDVQATTEAHSQLEKRVAALETSRDEMASRLATLEQRSEKDPLFAQLREVKPGATGAETCAAYGESCIALTPSRTYTAPRHGSKFIGYAVPSCSARVEYYPSCLEDMPSDQAIAANIQRHPHSRASDLYASGAGQQLCLGRKLYQHAVFLTTPKKAKK